MEGAEHIAVGNPIEPDLCDGTQAPAGSVPLAGELDTEEIKRLKTALSMLVGTEAMIALRDVLRLDHEEARTRGEWAVRQMVRAARQRVTDDADHNQ